MLFGKRNTDNSQGEDKTPEQMIQRRPEAAKQYPDDIGKQRKAAAGRGVVYYTCSKR